MSSGPLQDEFRPVRGLANVLVIILAVLLAAIAARLTLDVLRLGAAPTGRYSFMNGPLDVAVGTINVVFTVLFLVWFYRARINAERYDYPQRRARSWAFWGWIVPVVNLWFPFQVMGDIWRAGLPPWQRAKTAWFPALWWTCWLLSGGTAGSHAMAANPAAPVRMSVANNAVSLGFLGIAGVLLIPIIRAVSRGPVGSAQ